MSSEGGRGVETGALYPLVVSKALTVVEVEEVEAAKLPLFLDRG